ncbi:hypothetical protein SGPA1_20966 [Streptomyces misionensis JCM 4497]
MNGSGGADCGRECLPVDHRRLAGRLVLAAAGPGLLLAHGREASVAPGARVVALRLRGRTGPGRGRRTAREPAVAAGAGLSGAGGGLPGGRRQHGRHRGAGPRAVRAARRAAAHGDVAGRAPRGLDGQAVGGAARHRAGAGARARVPAADRRGHRARPGQPARAGGGGRHRRLRRGVADGAAAGGKPVGAAGGAGVRVLLRAAVSLPVDRPYGFAHGGRGGRLCAAADRHGGAGPDPGRHPARGHRRRLPRPRGEGCGRAGLAGARRPGGQRAALSAAARPVADGLAQRLCPTAAQPTGVAGHGGRSGAGVPGAAGGRRLGRGGRQRDDGTRRRAGVGGDGGHVRADAALLPAAPVARSAAAVHRVPVPADDGGLGGAALPGARGRLEGPYVHPARCRAGRGLNRSHLRPGVQFMPQP